MADDPREHPRRTPVNVRGDLIGHEGAEELEVEDDRTTALATLVLGLLLVVVAIGTITQATQLSNGGNAVGPATAPWVIGALLLVVGVLMSLHGRRDLTDATQDTPWHQTAVQDWKRLGVLVAALVVFAIINPFLGYVVSATLLFGITAIVLGAPDRAKAFAYGFIVAGTVYLLFDVLIGISLPAGLWGF
jgi:putative tricarboxylic transport membrane protein